MSNYDIVFSINMSNNIEEFIVMKDGVDVMIFSTRQEAEEYINQQENL